MYKANMTDETRLLRIPDAASRSGLGQHHLRRIVAAGQVRHIREGRLILVDYPDLERWMDETTARAAR